MTLNNGQLSDYHTYLELKKDYTNKQIARFLDYSLEDLGYLISHYTFENALEYQISKDEGDYYFNGTFYVTKTVHNTLTSQEIIEIYTFTQDLVKQHKGIDYLQVFFSIEHDCKLFFIDQLNQHMLQSGDYKKEHHYCTLMLASEY